MSRVLTTDEKATQRTPGQWGRPRLIVPEIHTIYTATLSAVPSSNDMVAQITFTGGSGTLANVLADMMLYVGTSAGGYELGMCRIRKAPIAGTFYIGETSDIAWDTAGTIYLTVVDDYSLWQKSIRIVSQTPYMDWDVAYSDQHEDFTPIANLGCDAVAKLVNGSASAQVGSSEDIDSWVFDSTISTYAWTGSGVTFDNAAIARPTVTATATGTYLLYCTVTAANGKTMKGVRYFVVWDDDDPHITNFLIRNGRENWDTGGCSFEVLLMDSFNVDTLRERSRVILVSEDYAGVDPISLPSQIEGRENHVITGWVSNIDTSRQAEFGEITCRVESGEYWMKQIRDYPVGLEFTATTASAWTQMPGLSVDRAVWHMLHWRSTASRIMDITLTDDTRYAKRFQTLRANLWERIIQVSEPTIWARPGVDNFGRFFLTIEPQMVAEDSRTWPNVMTITDDDLEDGITWRKRDVKELSMLFFSAVNINESGNPRSFFSMSPGHSYAHHGQEERRDNYLTDDQESSNQTCGLYYGWKNNDTYDLQISFIHSMRILGIWPRQKYTFDISAQNDPRGIGVMGEWVVREIDFDMDPDTGFIRYSAILEPESEEGPAINGDVPTMEDIDFSLPDLPDLGLPGFGALPSLPYIPLPSTVQPTSQPSRVVIWSNNYGFFYTENFSDVSPSWVNINNNLTSSQYLAVGDVVVTPSGKVFALCQYSGGFAMYKKIMCAIPGGNWEEVYDSDSLPEADAYCSLSALTANPTVEESVAAFGGREFSFGSSNGQAWLILGDSSGMAHVAESTSSFPFPKLIGSRNEGLAYGNGAWYTVTNQASGIGGALFVYALNKFTLAGVPALTPVTVVTDGSYNLTLIPVGLQGGFWLYGDVYSDQISNALGLTSGINGFDVAHAQTYKRQRVAVSPTGTHAMGVEGITPYKTEDGGVTWDSVGGVLSTGADVWENCRDNFRWIFGGGPNVKLTMDQGSSYENKIGSLQSTHPAIDVTSIRFME